MYFEKSFIIKKQLITTAKSKSFLTLPLSDVSKEHVNYIIDRDNNCKYFLYDNDLDFIYDHILHTALFNKGTEFDFYLNQTSVRLSKMRENVSYCLGKLLSSSEAASTGRPNSVLTAIDALQGMFNIRDLSSLVDLILFKLEDLILTTILKDELTDDSTVDFKETSLCINLGYAIFIILKIIQHAYYFFTYGIKSIKCFLIKCFMK